MFLFITYKNNLIILISTDIGTLFFGVDMSYKGYNRLGFPIAQPQRTRAKHTNYDNHLEGQGSRYNMETLQQSKNRQVQALEQIGKHIGNTGQ